MKVIRNLLICSFILVTGLTGCSTDKGTPVSKNETIYIGDNSKVIELADSLPYPKEVAYSSIEIQSETEPYELKIFLDGAPKEPDSLQECADQAFERISNMGVISFYEKNSHALIKSFEAGNVIQEEKTASDE